MKVGLLILIFASVI